MTHLNGKSEHYLKLLSAHHEPYKSCHELSSCIKNLVEGNETEEFKKCIDSIMALYQENTDYVTRNAVENILLYRMGTDIMLCKDRRKMFGLLPVPFRKIITDQMTCSGI